MATATEKAATKLLQDQLIMLGCLPRGADDRTFGRGSTSALLRYQRHAGHVYRVLAASTLPASMAPKLTFKGAANGKADDATLAEIKKWLDDKRTLPLSRFAPKKVGDLTPRERVADA